MGDFLKLDCDKEIILESIIIDIKALTADDFSGHDFMHSFRVMKNAEMICEKEGGNLFLILIASLLHDVDDKKISPLTFCDKTNARNLLLKYNFNQYDTEFVLKIIDSISFSHGSEPDSLEARIVQDADRLDALGAIGIARCFAYSGNKSIAIYNKDDLSGCTGGSDTAISHFYDKLFKLSGLMKTESGRRIAEKRTDFIKLYLDEFLSEIEYKDL